MRDYQPSLVVVNDPCPIASRSTQEVMTTFHCDRGHEIVTWQSDDEPSRCWVCEGEGIRGGVPAPQGTAVMYASRSGQSPWRLAGGRTYGGASSDRP